jgi:pimeloyl-ACP methyl ester carboxylesterase
MSATTGAEPIKEIEVDAGNGRVLHAYDTAVSPADTRLPVFWHHGTPNIGSPPEPLFAAAERNGMRWVSYDRPGYGPSTPVRDRDIAAAAADVATIADALGIGRFAVLGHSGGAPHALACAALLAGRVVAAVSVSGLAPFAAEGLDWFAGMYPGGAAELSAAASGRAELEACLAGSEFDPEMFTPADTAAFAGDWSWLAGVAGKAIGQGPGGMIDDDLAYTRPWGFEPGSIAVPVLLLHGDSDRIVPSSQSEWLARRIGGAELWLRPGHGHISILGEAPAAVAWLAGQAGQDS